MTAKEPKAPTLYFIIAIKLAKGLLLLTIALGFYKLAGQDLQEEFDTFLRVINLDPEKKFFSQIGVWLDTLTANNVRWFATGTLLYSLFSFVEGIGLISRVSWAGWLAIGESAFFIPIEVYEMMHHFTKFVFVILILNILIVWYLYQNRARLFHHHHHHPAKP